jgi:single-strand DNA-binding protein
MDVVTFGKTAENAGQYLRKGRQIFVEGRMQTRNYKDKDGNEKWRTEVVANQVVFLGGGGDRAGAPGGGGNKRPASNGAPAGDDVPPPPESGFIDDDLPF